MKCPKCNKTIVIVKTLVATKDAVTCCFCNRVIPSEELTWNDGKFHFSILGDVSSMNIPPRIIMKDQSISVLDLPKVLAKAKKIINNEPNLKALCGEFGIKESDLRVELILESNK